MEGKNTRYSRSVHHGNTRSKKGNPDIYTRNRQYKVEKGKSGRQNQHKKQHRDQNFGETVIKAGSSTNNEIDGLNPNETRFTIPLSPNNKNFFLEQCKRTFFQNQIVVEEVKRSVPKYLADIDPFEVEP
jgi:hypothetical protein